MNKTLVQVLEEVLRPINPLQFSQFTIDWIQELPDIEWDPTVDMPRSMCYRIETIRDVLKPGPDLKLFQVLAGIANIYISYGPKHDS